MTVLCPVEDAIDVSDDSVGRASSGHDSSGHDSKDGKSSPVHSWEEENAVTYTKKENKMFKRKGGGAVMYNFTQYIVYFCIF